MASDYPYSGSSDQQAYRQQPSQNQQHQQQQNNQMTQYSSPQLLQQQSTFDPYTATQFSQFPGGSQYTSMQPSSSSSSLRNNDNQRFSMMVRHPIRGGMPGNATVSPSPSRNHSSAKAPRARVNMACIHCRSRKIRCDGNQPMCATCSRLGRVCVYENISEQENAAVRDRKKKSREAKQARLDALTQLGVSMPRQQNAGSHESYRQRPYPMHSGTSNASSVMRSQFQAAANTMGQGMMPPSFPGQNRAWQSQMPTSQYVSVQSQNETNASNLTRRRGATVGGFEKDENEQQQQHEYDFWQKDKASNEESTNSNVELPYTPTIEANPSMATDNAGLLYDVIAPRINSLSQPATPEAAYRFHATMLSHELAATSSTSAGQPSPQDNSIFNNAYQVQPAAYSLGPAYQTNINTNHDNGTGSNSSAGSFSMIPGMPTSISEDNLYSAGSMYLGKQEQYGGNLSSMSSVINANNQSFQPATNTSNFAEDQFGQQTESQQESINEVFQSTEEQRRRSIDEKKIWKRTTNSDAAIARFFARVVAAKEGETMNNEIPICGPGGYNIPAWSQNTKLSLAQDTSIASSSASSWSGQEISGMTGSSIVGDGQLSGSTELTGNAKQIGQSNAHTPESTGPVRRGSEMSHLSQISHLSQPSILPLSANNTPPSDAANFRNQRPPPLRFDSLPTFAQQLTQQQQQQQQQDPANGFVESPMTTIQGSGTNMSASFSQQRMQPSVLTPLSASSSSIPLRSPSYINPNLSPDSHSNMINQNGSPLASGVQAQQQQQQQQQQDLTSISRPFQTPVTELSSHLFALGHSRGHSEGSSEEQENYINRQQ